MQTYAQYCPISRTLDLVGDRWSLLVVRELIIGSTRFNEIARGLPGLSRGLLTRRLRQLEAAGIIERCDGAYALTPSGEELTTLVMELAAWGARNAFGPPEPEELDPDLLMWWMHSRIDTAAIDRRAVIAIHLTDLRRRYWLLVEHGDVSICHTDPGYEVDVVLQGNVSSLYRVWLGHDDLREALRQGDLTLEGSPAMVRALPGWLQLSQVAPIVVEAQVGAGAR
jgi:DNA-binding HxlR family transcriptional regulator